ncbi:hypothetical protein M413DRAFT_440178 [Hebeloma cylindrosporum]|uniref:Nucleolar 27S pre-rRNA processing Urb2/Npa2 C-terminal domain-containing protein n=1 Tax=Hebeloma cylindrosporum TaxID=76867 RepID=A0A0C3CWB1_HEBCY|nr:hypothetical protein M413DRAFT_440178 [Hebeloma cylindrosporum h7]
MPEHSTFDTIESSQDFVRALRSASDPPTAGGPLKVEIAQLAWNNASFYVPSKAELIADWVLTKLLKEKGKEVPINPIFDARYWKLLSSLNLSQDSASPTAERRPTKTWLIPLLHRVPLGPVVVSFLSLFKAVDEKDQMHIADLVSSCLSTLWPIAVQRMNTELLQECYGSLLNTLSLGLNNSGISKLGRMVSTSYHNSLTNSSNKKKLAQSFLQTHLRSWFQALSAPSASHDGSFRSAILDAGVETLFNLDVLRQSYDSKNENFFVESLEKIFSTDGDLVMQNLPILLAQYISANKKHRGALFSQGSQAQSGASLDELHETGMRFFSLILGLVKDSNQGCQAWQTRVLLLQIVERENIFSSKQLDSQITFNRILELILVALNDGWKQDYLERTSLAVQCLSTIAKIDFDLVIPFVTRCLPLLLQIPTSEHPLEFLGILLSYHTKTRTMTDFIQNLFASLSSRNTLPCSSRETYQRCFSSSIMSTAHLERLSRALQSFLTEGQCIPMTNLVFDTLKASWEQVHRISRRHDGEQEQSKAKTKIGTTIENDAEELAITYSLVAQLSSLVLSALPLASLSSTNLKTVQQLLVDFRTDFVHHTLLKSVKAISKQGNSDFWAGEVSMVANLRLLYALDISRNLALPVEINEKLCKKMLELAFHDSTLPELNLELFRLLLYTQSLESRQNHQELFDRLLLYLEKHFSPAGNQWSGHGHHLTKDESGKGQAALAIMHLIIERWMPEIDRLASSKQLERLLKIILSIQLPSNPQSSQELRPEHLLLEVFHSAQFWELPNIRDVFLDLLDKMTSTPEATAPRAVDLARLQIYRYLLFIPMEYFSWQLFNDLVKRVVEADMALCQLVSDHDQGATEVLITLRIFLKRAYIYSGSVAQESSTELAHFLVHLLETPMPSHGSNPDFTKATLDLAQIYFSKLLKVSKKHGAGALLKVLKTFPPDLFVDSQGMSSANFIALVDLLSKEFPPTSLPEEVVAAFRQLHVQISSSLMPGIISATETPLDSVNLEKITTLCSGWHCLLSLGKWLGSTATTIAFVGEKLSSMVLRSMKVGKPFEFDGLCVTTLAILLQEIGSRPLTEHPKHLEFIIAVYLEFFDAVDKASQKELDDHLARACKGLELSDYIHLQSLVSESLSNVEVLRRHLLHLVHLAALLLREHPSHSLVHIQKFATRCIHIFSEKDHFVRGPIMLRLEVLEMVAQHCSYQQAALRSLDAAGIWLLLSKYLAPSVVHDQDTEPIIFHKIVAILSSLIRLRRDLVSHALPHLGMILRQLLLCMRSCRPHLGAKQTSIVMNTQPLWMSASQPLGAEEAKILGRLLESLNTKTTVRVLSSSATSENQKPESLAKPFSKHAVYVLKAYIEAMNDPLCLLPLDVRKELQPGIFALCSMVSEHSRDSLMISALDGGGKMTFKALWKEYDKQRYVGKG